MSFKKTANTNFSFLLALAGVVLFASSSHAQDASSSEQPFFKAVTLEGGPIASKHFQSGNENFHERHGLGIVKMETQDYGTWGVYLLSPNSVERTSVGAGYVTDPWVIPISDPMRLELTAALGLVTGYQDYPLPLIAGEARLVLYEDGPFSAGASMVALPYIMKDDRRNGRSDNEFGVVVTTPFLSLRYQFE